MLKLQRPAYKSEGRIYDDFRISPGSSPPTGTPCKIRVGTVAVVGIIGPIHFHFNFVKLLLTNLFMSIRGRFDDGHR